MEHGMGARGSRGIYERRRARCERRRSFTRTSTTLRFMCGRR